jgi:hypothetical protein
MKKTSFFLGICGIVVTAWAPAAIGVTSSKSKADLLKGSYFLDHVRYLASDDLGSRHGSRSSG